MRNKDWNRLIVDNRKNTKQLISNNFSQLTGLGAARSTVGRLRPPWKSITSLTLPIIVLVELIQAGRWQPFGGLAGRRGSTGIGGLWPLAAHVVEDLLFFVTLVDFFADLLVEIFQIALS